MKKAKIYFIPETRFEEVPDFIEKVAGDFIKKDDFVALKIHFGEKGNRGYIKPEWVKPVVNAVKAKKANAFLTDTNTIYRGQRADAVNHLMLANGHGFKMEKVGAPVIIADGLRGNDYVKIEVDGKHFKTVKIARAIHDAHSMIVLSHVKGHILSGFGGAIKNLGMGCAPKPAKYEMHSSVSPKVVEEKCVACEKCIVWCPAGALSVHNKKIFLDDAKCIGCGECIQACPEAALEIPWDQSSSEVQERLVDHAAAVVRGKAVCYVNYMHYISKYCDCFETQKDDPILDHLGILISTDPIAIDKASVDIINKEAGKDLFKELHGKDYLVQLECAEKLGMGTQEYEIIEG